VLEPGRVQVRVRVQGLSRVQEPARARVLEPGLARARPARAQELAPARVRAPQLRALVLAPPQQALVQAPPEQEQALPEQAWARAREPVACIRALAAAGVSAVGPG
jgi:hypothetical protein